MTVTVARSADGHVARRFVGNGNCAGCADVKNLKRGPRHVQFQPGADDEGTFEAFAPKRTRIIGKIEDRLSKIRTVFDEYREQDLILSVRRIQDTIGKGRLEGVLDWDMIEDRSRILHDVTHWNSPAQRVAACARGYSIDYWKWQQYMPLVLIEKDALIGVIENVCDELRLPYMGLKGFNSISKSKVFSGRLKEAIEDGREPIIFHLGDHDPAGLSATDGAKGLRATLSLMARQPVEVVRLALNLNQVKGVPANMIKDEDEIKDTRYPHYRDVIMKGRQPEMWELDALEPRVIGELIRKAATKLIDKDEWSDAQDREQNARAAIAKIAKHKSLQI